MANRRSWTRPGAKIPPGGAAATAGFLSGNLVSARVCRERRGQGRAASRARRAYAAPPARSDFYPVRLLTARELLDSIPYSLKSAGFHAPPGPIPQGSATGGPSSGLPRTVPFALTASRKPEDKPVAVAIFYFPAGSCLAAAQFFFGARGSRNPFGGSSLRLGRGQETTLLRRLPLANDGGPARNHQRA
jgi:hypothetical protein